MADPISAEPSNWEEEIILKVTMPGKQLRESTKLKREKAEERLRLMEEKRRLAQQSNSANISSNAVPVVNKPQEIQAPTAKIEEQKEEIQSAEPVESVQEVEESQETLNETINSQEIVPEETVQNEIVGNVEVQQDVQDEIINEAQEEIRNETGESNEVVQIQEDEDLNSAQEEVNEVQVVNEEPEENIVVKAEGDVLAKLSMEKKSEEIKPQMQQNPEPQIKQDEKVHPQFGKNLNFDLIEKYAKNIYGTDLGVAKKKK